MILKTRVKVNVHLLGPSTHVSAKANSKGTQTLMHVLKKWRKPGTIMKLLDSISELISNIDIPEI